LSAQAPVDYVDPFIGTLGGGFAFPGPSAPYGMVQLSPDTPNASPSGYRFSDTQIEEFSFTHFNGAGCANNEDIGILPITGGLPTQGPGKVVVVSGLRRLV
jgi:putative alpha-1,2-mannosidase